MPVVTTAICKAGENTDMNVFILLQLNILT